MSEQPRFAQSEQIPEYGFQNGAETLYPQTPNRLYGPAAGPTDHEVYVGALADALDAAESAQPKAVEQVDRSVESDQTPLRILSVGIRVNSQLRKQHLEGFADQRAA